MQETVIQNIIFDLKKEKNISPKEIINRLQIALEKERKQIIEAFEDGMKYGSEGMFPHCDFPASRYYVFTFEKGAIKDKLIELDEKGIQLFDTKTNFDLWLNTPNLFFDNRKPKEDLSTLSGIQFIYNRLVAMEFGDNV